MRFFNLLASIPQQNVPLKFWPKVSDGRFSVDCRAQLVFGIGQVFSCLQDCELFVMPGALSHSEIHDCMSLIGQFSQFSILFRNAWADSNRPMFFSCTDSFWLLKTPGISASHMRIVSMIGKNGKSCRKRRHLVWPFCDGRDDGRWVRTGTSWSKHFRCLFRVWKCEWPQLIVHVPQISDSLRLLH